MIAKLEDIVRPPAPGADIYELAIYAQKLANCKKHPYQPDWEKIGDAEKARIILAAETEGIDQEAALRGASSSLYAWYRLALPSVSRQSGKFEAVLKKYLDSVLPLSLKLLPNGGANALYLQGGNAVSKSRLTAASRSSLKSIDLGYFRADHSSLSSDIYLVAKRTVGDGGGQDNQRNDAISFLEAHDPQSANQLILVLDGSHYRKTDPKTGISRMDAIRAAANSFGLGNAFIGDYREVANKLAELLPSS